MPHPHYSFNIRLNRYSLLDTPFPNAPRLSLLVEIMYVIFKLSCPVSVSVYHHPRQISLLNIIFHLPNKICVQLSRVLDIIYATAKVTYPMLYIAMYSSRFGNASSRIIYNTIYFLDRLWWAFTLRVLLLLKARVYGILLLLNAPSHVQGTNRHSTFNSWRTAIEG